jgi:hypothetical protein
MDSDHDGLTDGFEQQSGTLGPAAEDPTGGLHTAALPLGSGTGTGAGFDDPTFGVPGLH